MESKPAYITIVEGPPPDFLEVINRWAIGVQEGPYDNEVALVEMRAFNGKKLVQRCENAWQEGRGARLDFPLGDGERGEMDILAARSESVSEGDKLYLWVRLDGEYEIVEEEDDSDDNLSSFGTF